MTDPVTDYARAVLAGDQPAGPYIVWAAQRHMDDLQRDDLVWDPKEAHRRAKFFGLLSHYKGQHAGQRFELRPWQVFRIGSVYGWRWAESGRRRFTEAYTEIPRKNGKTTEAAGIALGGMTLDGEQGAEVYAVATKRDQAKIVWSDAKQMVDATPELKQMITTYVSNMNCPATVSKFEPLGRDSKTLDGLNPSLAVYDEFHAWRDPYLRTVIANGMGSRAQPLEWIITTAGTDTSTICWEMREHCVHVLDPDQPDFTDDHLFAYIASTWPDDDPGDPATWRTANPNLGVSKSEEYMVRAWERAQARNSEMSEFLSKHLNIWTEAAETWLPLAKWDECARLPVDASALEGRPCYLGLDLAQVNDLSALAIVFPLADQPWPVLWRFYCPQENIVSRSRYDKVPYDRWAREGLLTATPGETTDFSFVREDILQVAERHRVEHLLYDRWGAHQLVTELTEAGISCQGYGQGYRDQSPALAEIERRVIGRELAHGDHPIVRWMAGNAVVDRDPAGNIKLNKRDPRQRIDGLAALANAVGGVLQHAAQNRRSVYEDRGILSL